MLYRIADFNVEVTFSTDGVNDERLIPSLAPFRIDGKEDGTDFLFRLNVDDALPPMRENRERIGKFDTGNGDTIVDRFPDGAYQYIIKDVEGRECCLLQTNASFSQCSCALKGNFLCREFGLNNALMLVFAFASSFKKALLIHASLVRHSGRGYAFIAKSGTGKSTQVSNWLRYIPDCDLMNDDNPIIRIIDGEAFIYGSPWSGKTPCYRNVKAPLGAVTRIDRASHNWVERLRPVEAFASFLPACSSMKWDKQVFNNVCDSVTDVIRCSRLYILHCLPDRESAIVCHDAIAAEDECMERCDYTR